MSEWSERYAAYLRSSAWLEKRAAVLVRCGGVCESCDTAPATEVHHTTYDHVFNEPLWELRAVCAECHDAISEADGVELPKKTLEPTIEVTMPTKKKTPREWQSRGADECVSRHEAGADRALVYACPGSGKTYGSLHIAKSLIHRCRRTSELIVITPNLAIRTQWVATARELGIALEEITDGAALRQNRINMGEPHGFVLGYQQAIRLKHSLRTFCETTHPVVILDEVHHTAGRRADRDGNAWGHAVEYAFQHASFKLPTTGTPFREGDDPIAFVQYNEAGEAQASVRYPYGDAIADGVCRQVEFEFFDGYVQWRTRGGRQITADFSKKLSQKLQRERLESALSTEGEFPVTMLTAAHEKLLEIRTGAGAADADAAGLVVAIDVDHAQQLADLLEEITGEKPVVVHSRLDEAQDLISGFRSGSAKWIIGISMISEGVDIPRLRVGVYATRVRTALYFHQFVGRFTRVQESRDERSFVFLPRDAEIEAIAIEIEKERYHAIGQEPPPRRRRRPGTGTNGDTVEVIDSESELVASATGGVSFPVEFQRKHGSLIRRFRSENPFFSSWSDAAILQVHVATKAIEPPREINGASARPL